MTRVNLWLFIGVVALAVLPFCIPRPQHAASFAGSDDRATETITRVDPHYHRWAVPIFQPPSGEVESFLFAVEAALGAGVLCYYIGYKHGRREAEKAKEQHDARD